MRTDITSISRYETVLARLFGAAGVADAVIIVREKVYQTIENQYPALATECQNQRTRRGML